MNLLAGRNYCYEYTHRKGGKYYFIAMTNMDCDNPDFIPTVVYCCANSGKLYSRPLSEWEVKFSLSDVSEMTEERKDFITNAVSKSLS